MKKTLIIGLNSNTKKIVEKLSGPIAVVDDATIKTKGEYVTFESDKVLALYQASLMAGQMEHNDFEASSSFYEQLSNQQFELAYHQQKELIEYLEKRNIEIIKGRFSVIEPFKGQLAYLNEKRELPFSRIILNTEYIEENFSDSPFIFTFAQLLTSHQLFKRILVNAKTLRGLEIASMFARFGSDVTLVTSNRLFSEIEHLMFRDAIRETLVSQNIHLMEKYEVTQTVDLEASLLVKLNPTSRLAFEIVEPLVPQEIEVDAMIIESDALKPTFSESEEDFSKPLRTSKTLFLNPVYSLVESQEQGDLFQFDAQAFSYFQNRFEIDGGLEFVVKDDYIIGGTFYCHNALEVTQLLKLVNHMPLSKLKDLDVFNNSLLGVFKEASIKILEKGGEDNARQETSRFN